VSGGVTSANDNAIVVEGLTKSFGDVHALAGVDLVVPRGSVLGVLGPNGAGKTTAVKILTTLLRPDAGTAVVDGRDVVKDPAAVRRSIGLAGQSAAIVEELTGRENLELMGRLYHLGKPRSKQRAQELRGGSTSLRAWSRSPRCSSWMSRPPGSTRGRATTCGR
jgi:ABC-2 type transport system ATP-binding protein